MRIDRILLTLGLCGMVQGLSAQEPVAREDALKAAFLTHVDLKSTAALPVRVDADLKYPFALRAGAYGVLVLPETKLTADTLAKAGREPVAVGELWMRNLTLLREGQPVSGDKLVLVPLPREMNPAPVCALAIRQPKEGQLELLVYGKDKQPLLTVPVKKTDLQQDYPLELTAQDQGGQGRLTLRLAGKYEASFMLAKADAF